MAVRDQVIAVTGAAGALGARVVQRLGEAGARVAALDLAAEIPGEPALALAGVALDDPEAAMAAMARIEAGFGRLDGLVNIAGGFRWQTLADGDLATWDLMYAMNLRSAVATTQAALPLLRAVRGAIVNVGAAAAVKAGAGFGAYAASKAGVARLTEALAEELRGDGVRVNAILPTIIDTPANRRDMPKADFSKWVTPDEIGAAVEFLLSAEASGITGALLPVSGRV
ncbi:MAG: SDR family oxidoreductase [Caulobacteraceae bacterium]